MDQSVYAVATMDTKGHEMAFVAERLRAAGVNVVTVDVGTLDPPIVTPDVDRSAVLACHPDRGGGAGPASPAADRGEAIAAMSQALDVVPGPRASVGPSRRGVRDRRQRRDGPDHARDAVLAGRAPQIDGLDGRQREHGRRMSAWRHHDDALGRRHRRFERRLAPRARQRGRGDGRHGATTASRRRRASRRSP